MVSVVDVELVSVWDGLRVDTELVMVGRCGSGGIGSPLQVIRLMVEYIERALDSADRERSFDGVAKDQDL